MMHAAAEIIQGPSLEAWIIGCGPKLNSPFAAGASPKRRLARVAPAKDAGEYGEAEAAAAAFQAPFVPITAAPSTSPFLSLLQRLSFIFRFLDLQVETLTVSVTLLHY